MREFIKKYIPKNLRTRLNKTLKNLPRIFLSKKKRWVLDEYTKHARNERSYIFLSVARFMHINRPTTGGYFEFGCHEANTMRLAYRHFRHLFNFQYYAFDSFQGLPEITEIDKQEIWKKGKLLTQEPDFRKIVEKAGMPSEKLTTIPGFYNETLNENLDKKLGNIKAAVIYIDCDLYESTVPVLKWVVKYLQRGTIIVFDDWFCFHGDPNYGEQKAWNEFCKKNPRLRFSEFVTTSEAKSFIFLGED